MHTAKKPTAHHCRYLRGKNGHGTTEGGENAWFGFDRVTTVYNCLRTTGPVGPDDYFASAEECRAGRSCFVAPVRVEKG
jgi:hypothetical protein